MSKNLVICNQITLKIIRTEQPCPSKGECASSTFAMGLRNGTHTLERVLRQLLNKVVANPFISKRTLQPKRQPRRKQQKFLRGLVFPDGRCAVRRIPLFFGDGK